mmetsp:Transcript_9124/g.23423  ORF Transcript_9124/g.23423 Transcript_9124/m.23423 type:complete len:86 (-) Transcript_9124:913-1170(-)
MYANADKDRKGEAGGSYLAPGVHCHGSVKVTSAVNTTTIKASATAEGMANHLDSAKPGTMSIIGAAAAATSSIHVHWHTPDLWRS